jgi:hypothetical protein
MKLFPLTSGLNPSPYTQAFLDGTVRAKGFRLFSNRT